MPLGSELPTSRTFDALTTEYKLSPEFSRRAHATQHYYRGYLNLVSKAWGQLHVGSVRPKHVLQLRDAWSDTPVAANHKIRKEGIPSTAYGHQAWRNSAKLDVTTAKLGPSLACVRA